MKKSMKSYLVFTSLGYRLILYLGVPLFCAGLELFMLTVLKTSGVMTVMCALVAAEIASDTWFLGGIQEKNAEKMDYLKTSSRGMSVMKSALAADLVRRFVMAAGICGICCLLEMGAGKGQPRVLTDLVIPVLAVYSLSTTAVLITRFFGYFYINLLAGYIASATAGICGVLLSTGVWSAGALLAGYAALGTAAGILAVWVALKKVEGGYYDK